MKWKLSIYFCLIKKSFLIPVEQKFIMVSVSMITTKKKKNLNLNLFLIKSYHLVNWYSFVFGI